MQLARIALLACALVAIGQAGCCHWWHHHCCYPPAECAPAPFSTAPPVLPAGAPVGAPEGPGSIPR